MGIKQILGKHRLYHLDIVNPAPTSNKINKKKKIPLLVLPYAPPKSEKLVTLLKRGLKINLPENIVKK